VGIIRDTTETILIAKYEAVEVEREVKNDEGEVIEKVKEIKGKVITTYGHKGRKRSIKRSLERRKNAATHHN